MLRFTKVVMLMAALSIFGAQNWDNVPINLFMGGTRVHLFLLLLMAAGAGYVLALVRGIQHQTRQRQKNRRPRSFVRIEDNEDSEDSEDSEDEPIEVSPVPRRRRS